MSHHHIQPMHMGNQLAHGGLFVYTEKPGYIPGENVSGRVYMNVVAPITSRGVSIKITGREKVTWTWKETTWIEPTEEGGERKPEYTYHERKGKSDFFKLRVPLYQTAGQFFPGNYEFPFSFDLPQGLPGVFKKEMAHAPGDCSDLKSSIEYKIKGECDIAGGEDFKHKFNFVLNERPVKHIQAASKTGSAKVTQCCCINKGDATMTVRMDKNAYAPGETMQVVCEVDNNSSVNIEKVSVQLHQSMKFIPNEGHSIATSRLVSHANFPGITAHTKCLDAEARYVPLKIEGVLEPETHGKHIQCTYYCVVNLDVPYGGDIAVSLPVNVYAPQPPSAQWEQMKTQLPPGWNPQVYGAVNIGALPIGVPPPVTPAMWADPFASRGLPPPLGASPQVAPLLPNAYPAGGPPSGGMH